MFKRQNNDPDIESRAEKLHKERYKQDLKQIIELVLQSPLMDKGEVVQVDGELSLTALSKMNTDVQTRIIMQIAKDAATGDTKSAEFLMKYGGMEPPKQQHITMDVPIIVDDMECRATPVVSAIFDRGEEDEDEDEKEDDDGS